MADTGTKGRSAPDELTRLASSGEWDAPWRRWGPYLSERQWGTVREDYSLDGDAWGYFPHDHARSRAYHWGEDGLAGVSDDKGLVCLALALWNGADPIVKERLFGLTNSEGNHGEDVKEYYFYVDNTPTHSWMRWRYKYPHAAYPYDDLVRTNAERGYGDREYELLDTGVFDDDRYFDVEVDYAKAGPDDLLMRVTVRNPLPQAAELEVRLVGPRGWQGSSTVVSAEGRAEVSCDLIITPDGACRRQPFAVELTANGRPFGQVAEALLTAGGERF